MAIGSALGIMALLFPAWALGHFDFGRKLLHNIGFEQWMRPVFIFLASFLAVGWAWEKIKERWRWGGKT